ncbi:hypothetical protein GGR57DRAFT_479924 [Xylariaceae sp. FL1272]|nr:hypothetical protein GGR57DRAFT_479924 [Xylariaceae sp. FL1272]
MASTTVLGSVASTLGILSSTGFFAMNSTINYLTMPTLLLGSPIKPSAKTDTPTIFSTVLGEPSRSNHPQASREAILPSTSTPVSSVSHLNRQWKEVYWRGHRYGPASAIFSTVCFLTAAWSSRPLASAPNPDIILESITGVEISLKMALYIAAAAGAFFAWPYTQIVMVPGANDELHARGDRIAVRNGLGDGMDVIEDWKGGESEAENKETLQLIKRWTGYSKMRAAAAGVAVVLGVIASHL